MRGFIGVATWRHCEAQEFGILVLSCSIIAVAAIPALGVTEPDADVPSLSQLCEVDLFQLGFGVSKGFRADEAESLDRRTLGVKREEPSSDIPSSLGARLSTLNMRAWAEKGASNEVSKVIVGIGVSLLVLGQIGVLCLGSLPPARIMEQQPTRYPATSVMVFTLIMRLGTMAGFTVILPFASAMSESSGHGAKDSGYVIGMYSVGSIVGVGLYSFLPIQQLTFGYYVCGFVVLVGNLLRFLAGSVYSFTLLIVSQVVMGTQTGTHYHAVLAFTYHAKGAAVTPCFILSQMFMDAGILLGPVMAAYSSYAVKALGFGTGNLPGLAGVLVMAFCGLLFIGALLINGPLPPPQDDEHVVMAKGQVDTQAGNEVNLEGRGSSLGLLIFVCLSMFLRHSQRLLLESGIIYVLEEYYKWTPEQAGFVMPIIVYCLILEVLCVTLLKGLLSDRVFLLVLEIKQLVGCALMLFGATRQGGSFPWCLLLGGMLIYGANAVFGGVIQAYCTKRSRPHDIASREGVNLAAIIGAMSGICFGGLASRVVLGDSPSPLSLALLMLGACCFQFITSVSTLELQELRESR